MNARDYNWKNLRMICVSWDCQNDTDTIENVMTVFMSQNMISHKTITNNWILKKPLIVKVINPKYSSNYTLLQKFTQFFLFMK